MQLKFLGTGTSQGVPVIGCHCNVCTSADTRDHRLRSSVMITTNSRRHILIDCGPDFRQQMLANHLEEVDALLLTHEHNDHIIGLDDLRPLIFRNEKDIDIYSNKRVAEEVVQRFPYAFAEVRYPGAPSFDLHEIDGPFQLFRADIIPIEVMHGRIPIYGYRFGSLAYITDASSIPESEMHKLYNLDYLILNCIRRETPHPAHFILPEAIQLFHELQPGAMLLTHISHHMGTHAETEMELPTGMHLAYDGLELNFS